MRRRMLMVGVAVAFFALFILFVFLIDRSEYLDHWKDDEWGN